MSSFKCFSAAAGLALLASGGAQAAPVTWSVNGHQYEVVSIEGIGWSDAAAAAAALGPGWHLATITSQAENDFVAAQLPTTVNIRSHYWLGGSDAATEGTWTWVTGEAFTYTNWWAGEPNNVGEEDYVAFDLRGGTVPWQWNDFTGSTGSQFVRGFIAERLNAATQVPEPASLALLALGLSAAGLLRRPRSAR